MSQFDVVAAMQQRKEDQVEVGKSQEKTFADEKEYEKFCDELEKHYSEWEVGIKNNDKNAESFEIDLEPYIRKGIPTPAAHDEFCMGDWPKELSPRAQVDAWNKKYPAGTKVKIVVSAVPTSGETVGEAFVYTEFNYVNAPVVEVNIGETGDTVIYRLEELVVEGN